MCVQYLGEGRGVQHELGYLEVPVLGRPRGQVVHVPDQLVL